MTCQTVQKYETSWTFRQPPKHGAWHRSQLPSERSSIFTVRSVNDECVRVMSIDTTCAACNMLRPCKLTRVVDSNPGTLRPLIPGQLRLTLSRRRGAFSATSSMKSTMVIPCFWTAAQLVSGTPLTRRALGGTVIIRQLAKNSDAFVDTTFTIDLEDDRNPQGLKCRLPLAIPIDTPALMLTSLDNSLQPEAQSRAIDLNHSGCSIRHLRLHLRA